MIDLCASPVPVGLVVPFPIEPPIPFVSLMPIEASLSCNSSQSSNEELKKTVVIQNQSELKCSPRNKAVDTDNLPHNLPFPENFSIHVESAIKNGSVAPEQTQLIADVGTFYYGLSTHPKQGDYKRIAILVCQKFLH